MSIIFSRGLPPTNIDDVLVYLEEFGIRVEEAFLEGGLALGVSDDGVVISDTAASFDFVGAGVTVTEPVAGTGNLVVTIPGGGGGSSLITEDTGVPLSTDTVKYNFVGFDITEPVADEFDIAIPTGAGGAGGEFCPGYGFNLVNVSTWSIIGVDAANIFQPGRRLKFTDGASTYFGTVTASDYNVTTPGDTTISMSMEGGDVLTGTITEVCLTTSATAWSAIVDDPFSGTPIRAIATGVIAGTQYWVIVGDIGKLAYSTDAGLNWTTVATGTTENLNHVAYASDTEEFLAGGNAGVLLDSSNGTTWNLDTTSIPALATTGNSDVVALTRHSQNQWVVGANLLSTIRTMLDDQGTLTWTTQGATFSLAAGSKPMVETDDNSNLWWVQTAVDTVGFLTNITDAGFSNWSASIMGGATLITAHKYFLDGATDRFWYGASTGRVRAYSSSSGTAGDDQVTFGQQINDFVWSQALSRSVAVGNLGELGYIDDVDRDVINSWTLVTTGLDPTANFTAVEYNETDLVYVAVADNGQILRSSTGLGDNVLGGWILDTNDPFSGTPVNAMATGVIGGTNYWVAVGNSGDIQTSDDEGATWVSRTSGTTNNLLCIAYNEINESFAIGAQGEVIYSSDITTWSVRTATGLDLDVFGIHWFTPDGIWWLGEDVSGGGSWTMTEAGVFTVRDTAGGFNERWSSFHQFGLQRGVFGMDSANALDVYGSAFSTGPSTFVGLPFTANTLAQWEDGGATHSIIGGGAGQVSAYDVSTVQATHNATLSGDVVKIESSPANNNFCIVTAAGEVGLLTEANHAVTDSIVLQNTKFDGSAFTVCVWDPVASLFVAANVSGEIGWSPDGTV